MLDKVQEKEELFSSKISIPVTSARNKGINELVHPSLSPQFLITFAASFLSVNTIFSESFLVLQLQRLLHTLFP